MRSLYLSLLITLLGACQTPVWSAPPSTVKFVVIGDVMGHDAQLASAYDKDCKCYNYEPVFEDIAPLLKGADYTIGNLETTLPGKQSLYSGYPQFGSPDSLVTALKNAGIDMLTLANNHSVDKGKDALIRTISVVEKHGIKSLGTYESIEAYNKRRVQITEIKGIRFVFLNYTYGTNMIAVPKGTEVNLIEDKRIKEDLEMARKLEPDSIVVLYHFGTEYLHYPDKYQQKYVDFAIENGADIVIGGHPHTVQPFGYRIAKDRFGETKPRLIAWSLGNFVSNQRRRYTDGGMIFQFEVTKEGDKVSFHDVSYVPVWVHVERSKKGPVFRVVNTEDYLGYDEKGKLIRKKTKGLRKLPPGEFARMQVFYTDTVKHLEGSMKNVAPLNKNQSGKTGNRLEETAANGTS